MSPTRNPAPPRPEIVVITPLAGFKRQVAVTHDGKGGASLQMVHRVSDLAQANDSHPEFGMLSRSIAYLTEDQRIELARELVRGLLHVRLEVQR